MNYLIKNAWVIPITRNEWFRADVGIEQGKIVFVERDPQCAESFRRKFPTGTLTEINAEGKVLMPGLVNLHTHCAMTLFRSYADDMELMTWLNNYIWPAEAHLTEEHILAGSQLGMLEMIQGGTTTFADMYWHPAITAKAAREIGMRAMITAVMMDSRSDADVENELAGIIAEGCDRVRSALSPHAPYTCNERTLRYALQLAQQYKVPIHMHVAESDNETRIIAERYGKSPVAYLDSLGMFNSEMLAAHCVKMSAEDQRVLAERGVSVAHNPQSNLKLASGIAPVCEMLKAGINVGFGTDGASSNNDLDMFEEMRTASLLHKGVSGDPTVLSAYETLRMATLNGAKALGLDGVIGEIAPGRRADLILLDMEGAHLYPHTNIISEVVYCAHSHDVSDVMVDGQWLMRDRVVLTLDENAVKHQAQQTAEELFNLTKTMK